jgi:P pilus assembly chaperone PapD
VSLPVFVLPQTSLAPKLEWRATKREDGRLRLQATNAGAAHIEIAEVALSSLYDNKAVGGQKLAAYVLPDNSRQWMLRTDASLAVGAMLRVIAQTDAGDIRADIVLESDSAMAPAQPVVASTAPRQ